MGHVRPDGDQILPPSLIGIWNWDVRTDLIVACERVCEYFNVPAIEGIHGVSVRRMLLAVDPADLERLHATLALSLQTGHAFNATYTVISKMHGTRRVRASGQCFRTKDGQPSYLSGILVDADALQEKANLLSQVVEHLIEANDLAAMADSPLLEKLIRAVMVEAANQLAVTTQNPGVSSAQ